MTSAYEGAGGRWQDRVRAAAHTALAHMREDPARANFTVVESVHGGERAQLVLDRVFATLAGFIDEGRSLPGAPDSLSEVTAQSLNGAIARQMRIGIDQLDTERFAEALPQMMYAAVLPYVGPEAAAEELGIPPPPTGGPRIWAQADLGPLPSGQHGLSPEQVAESQRERLLAAVAELVAERGYGRAAITEIVKRATVANRVFYANFKSKDEAFIETFDAVVDHLSDLIAEAAGPLDEWPQRVIAALRVTVEFFESEPALARFCLIAPFTANTTITAHCRDRLAAAIPFLAAGRDLRSCGDPLPASTEDSLLGGVIAQLGRAAASDAGLTAQLPDLVEFVLAPYLGSDQAHRFAAGAL